MHVLNYFLILVLVIGIASIYIQLAFAQFQTPDQFQNPQFNNQFDQNQQFGNNQFQGQYDQNQGQFGQNQFQQPYQQFQQPYGTPYMQQGYSPYQQNQFGGLPIGEIIAALVGGGSAAAYTRRRANKLEGDNQLVMGEILKGKQVDAELARITYAMNQDKANQINDAPAIKLENLQNDVTEFTDKTAKS